MTLQGRRKLPKTGGQVVMWGAQSIPSGWDRVNWSAKTWVGNCPSCPPISYVPAWLTICCSNLLFMYEYSNCNILHIRVKSFLKQNWYFCTPILSILTTNNIWKKNFRNYFNPLCSAWTFKVLVLVINPLNHFLR